ncbi:MAG: amidohydrolase family protein [Nitrospirota bacterium]|nr:amidohydrolase family protein [Nitrospirota bacterium]
MKGKRFIDLHTHGIGRYDTRTGEPGDILKMAELHGMAGTGVILPTIYSGAVDEMRKNMETVKKAMEMQRLAEEAGISEITPARDHVPALILGVHLEGPFLNPVRCGALDGSSFEKPSISNLKKLIEGYEDIIKIITVAPEISGALKVTERCVELGMRVNMGHSDATYQQAADGKKAGASGITHIFNAMRPFHHRDPGLACLGLLDMDLYIEVIADGIHLHPRTLELVFNLKRLDRIILVTDSVKSPKTGRGAVLNSRGFLSGSSISMLDSVKILRDINITDAEIIEAARDNPARYIGSGL